MIQLRCTCGQALQVKDEDAGQQINCPACNASLRVPGAMAHAIQAADAPLPSPGREREPVDREDEPARVSGKAIGSLVTGLFAFCIPILMTILALILGILALGDINRSRGRVTGRGLAIAGIVCGIVGTLVSVVAVPAILVGLLVPAVQKVREAASRAQSQNNLKQMGLAVHAYHDVNRNLPPAAITDPTGKPLLSWRVAILPYIEENGLYLQFRLNEPWDSQHNLQLLSRMPKVYESPGDTTLPQFHTRYQVFTGPNTLFPTPGNKQKIAEIQDGVSNTLLIVEAADAVPWTKPDDVVVPPPGQPLPRLGGLLHGGFNALFADGSVRWIRADTPEFTLRLLIDPGDGQVIPPGWDR